MKSRILVAPFSNSESKVSKSRKQFRVSLILPNDVQNSEFRSFFGRIKEIINCFRDLLTFNKIKFVKHWVNEEVNFCLFFYSSFNISLFRDVDTIQEFTDILILDSCGLLDESGRLADGFDGVSCKL